MKSLKSLAKVLTLVYLATLGTACTIQQPSATPMVMPASTAMPMPVVDPLAQSLKDLEFQSFAGAMVGTIPPQMSSYRYDPALALGAMFEKVLKADALANGCDSRNAEDFVLNRIVGMAPLAGCVAQHSEPNHKFEERIVQGGVDAKINHLVGEAGVNTKYAFEFLVTNPAAASYPASNLCIDTAKVVLTPPSPRTCDLYFVTGATLTQVTYRQYAEIDLMAKYNAIVNVEGKAYGSSSHIQSLLVLSVDFISLGGWFDRDTAGFVLPPTTEEAVAVAEEVQSLTEGEFLEAYALPLEDTFLLPEVSIENLIADPALDLQLAPSE